MRGWHCCWPRPSCRRHRQRQQPERLQPSVLQFRAAGPCAGGDQWRRADPQLRPQGDARSRRDCRHDGRRRRQWPRDADGKTFRFVLTEPLKLHQSSSAAHAVRRSGAGKFHRQDARPAPAGRPGAAQADRCRIAARTEIALRRLSQFHTRLVFDWPRDVPYTVVSRRRQDHREIPGVGPGPICPLITRFQPAWVKNAAWHLDGAATVVEIETDSDSGFHDFKDGNKIVVDILAPRPIPRLTRRPAPPSRK